MAPALVAAEPETMELFIAGIRADYGTFEEFATQLGVGDATRGLRTALLTDA